MNKKIKIRVSNEQFWSYLSSIILCAMLAAWATIETGIYLILGYFSFATGVVLLLMFYMRRIFVVVYITEGGFTSKLVQRKLCTVVCKGILSGDRVFELEECGYSIIMAESGNEVTELVITNADGEILSLKNSDLDHFAEANEIIRAQVKGIQN